MRIFSILVSALTLVIISVGLSQAQTFATPTQYTVNIRSISMCITSDPNCASEEVLGTTPAAFNLANLVGSGTEPFNIDRYVDVAGDYQYVKLIIDNSVLVSGSVTGVANPGGGTSTCNTVAGGVATVNLGSDFNAQTSGINPTQGVMNYVVHNPIDTPPANPVVSFLSGNTQLQLIFDLGGSTHFNAGDLLPPYNVSFSVTNALGAIMTNPTTCVLFINAPSLTVTP